MQFTPNVDSRVLVAVLVSSFVDVTGIVVDSVLKGLSVTVFVVVLVFIFVSVVTLCMLSWSTGSRTSSMPGWSAGEVESDTVGQSHAAFQAPKD